MIELPIYVQCLYQSVVTCSKIVGLVHGRNTKEDVKSALKADAEIVARANEGERFGFKVLPITVFLHGLVCALVFRQNLPMCCAVVVACLTNIACLFSKHGVKVETRINVLVGYVQNVVGFVFACFLASFGPMLVVNRLVWMATDATAASICANENVPEILCSGVEHKDYSRIILCSVFVVAFIRRMFHVADMVINHEMYRETVQRRLGFKTTFAQHFVDTIYALTYGLLSQLSSMLLMEFTAAKLGPEQLNGIHLAIVMVLRGLVLNIAYNYVGTCYFIIHRLGHCKTIYYLFHREHHLPFNQGALSGALGSGFNEALIEVMNTTLPYVMIPGYDLITVGLYSAFNEFGHLYYNCRAHARVLGMKYIGLMYSTWRCPITFITNRFAIEPIFDGFFRYGLIDAKLDTEDVFHGQHHWKNAPYFGYGFYDSFMNNADKLEDVLGAYQAGLFRSMGKGFGNKSKAFDSKKHFS